MNNGALNSKPLVIEWHADSRRMQGQVGTYGSNRSIDDGDTPPVLRCMYGFVCTTYEWSKLNNGSACRPSRKHQRNGSGVHGRAFPCCVVLEWHRFLSFGWNQLLLLIVQLMPLPPCIVSLSLSGRQCCQLLAGEVALDRSIEGRYRVLKFDFDNLKVGL